ncbi:MAG: hypothetical protein R2838_03585 [Caldilineaceae bacterium]
MSSYRQPLQPLPDPDRSATSRAAGRTDLRRVHQLFCMTPTFDRDFAGLNVNYQLYYQAYFNIFRRRIEPIAVEVTWA